MNLTNLVARYKEKIGEIETAQNFLDKFSPWTNNTEIINSFWEAIEQNSTSFSWTHIDSNLKTLKLSKYEHYGIPNHIRGDIQNSKLYLCLTNPNIAKVDERKKGISDFYKSANSINDGDPSLKIIDSFGNHLKNDLFLNNHIMDISSEGSILFQELEMIENGKKQEDTYYLKHYFSNICMAYLGITDKPKSFANRLNPKELQSLKEMSKSIANLESYPFRSQNPNYKLASKKSEINMLSARTIIWRIVKNEIDAIDINPIFIFRRFNDTWLTSIKNVLKYDLQFTENEINNLLVELHDKYFLTFQKQEFKNSTSSLGRESLYRNNKKITSNEFNQLFYNLFKS